MTEFRAYRALQCTILFDTGDARAMAIRVWRRLGKNVLDTLLIGGCHSFPCPECGLLSLPFDVVCDECHTSLAVTITEILVYERGTYCAHGVPYRSGHCCKCSLTETSEEVLIGGKLWQALCKSHNRATHYLRW